MNELQRRKTYIGRRELMGFDRWIELGWGEIDAQRMEFELHTEARIFVHMAPEHIGGTGSEYPLVHHVRHSPDGFEWGYGGSGPSEAARCILLDWFDLGQVEVLEQAQGNRDGAKLPEGLSYQDFKAEFLIRVPQEGFTIPGARVGAWVAARLLAAH